MKKKLLLLSTLITLSSIVYTGCDKINNPFLPRAELTLTDVSGTAKIAQTFRQAGDFNIAEYSYTEPSITIENKPGLPRVFLKVMFVEFTIGNKKLPPQQFPLRITIPQGGTFTGNIPILGLSDEIVNAAYPNNSFRISSSGFAVVKILGEDDNSNIIGFDFSTPVKFETDPSGFKTPDLPTTNEDTGNNNNNNTGNALRSLLGQ